MMHSEVTAAAGRTHLVTFPEELGTSGRQSTPKNCSELFSETSLGEAAAWAPPEGRRCRLTSAHPLNIRFVNFDSKLFYTYSMCLDDLPFCTI